MAWALDEDLALAHDGLIALATRYGDEADTAKMDPN